MNDVNDSLRGFSYPEYWESVKGRFPNIHAVSSTQSKFKIGDCIELIESPFRAIAKKVKIKDVLWATPKFHLLYTLEHDFVLSDQLSTFCHYSVVCRHFSDEEINDIGIKDGIVYVVEVIEPKFPNIDIPKVIRIPENEMN